MDHTNQLGFPFVNQFLHCSPSSFKVSKKLYIDDRLCMVSHESLRE